VSKFMLPVIPAPTDLFLGTGNLVLDEGTAIVAPEPLQGIARYLQQVLLEESGLSLPIAPHGAGKAIRLSVKPDLTGIGSEGYLFTAGPAGVEIAATTEAGVFYGVQTLRQLLPLAEESRSGQAPTIPCLEIRDVPRFAWRGMMLDVARHFFDVDTVKQLLDALALLKMNTLHLHLCDDQGWRLEIERYPRLIEIGSTRPETQIGGFLSRKTDGLPHRGYFTKADLRQIIAYAAERYITVVPEIELPGHCTAALAAYPELGCTGGPYRVATTAGIKKDIYCAGKEETFTFLTNVLDEVINLFPSPWIHIGGDEAPKNRWKACPRCQARIKAEGLRNEQELQTYFVTRIVRHLEARGRTAIGWNEILREGLPPSVIGQYWFRGRKKVLQHLRRGGRIIGSQNFYSYLDYNYGVLPLSKVYAYNPVPRQLEPRYRKNVLGIETPMWTETAPNREHMHAFVFPRLIAAAENGWTPPEAGRDFQGFVARLPSLLRRLRRMGIAHTGIEASQPGFFKRLILWTKFPKQSSELPEVVVKGRP